MYGLAVLRLAMPSVMWFLATKCPVASLPPLCPRLLVRNLFITITKIQDVLYPMTILDLPNMPATSWMYAMAPSILLVMA